MKKTFTSAILLIFIFQLQAQITIERSDYPLEIGDSTFRTAVTNSNELTIPATGTDLVWDFSNLTFNLNDQYYNFSNTAGTDPMVPESNCFSIQDSPSPFFPGLTFEATFFAAIDEEGYRTVGKTTSAEDYPLLAVTGSPTDSLNFQFSLSIYEDPSVRGKFPMNFGENENETNTLHNYFLLTIGAFGLSNVPGDFKVIRNSQRTIDSWGTIILTDPVTGLPAEFETLLVINDGIRVDSVLLAGAPAPQALLDLVGLAQGSETPEVEYEFWTKGLDGPILSIFTNSSGQLSGVINPGISDIILSTPKVAKNLLPVSVFPNPNNGTFQLEFEKSNSKVWSFDLYNNLGQIIHQQNIEDFTGNSKTTISLTSQNVGLYHYIIRNEKNTVMASGNIILD